MRWRRDELKAGERSERVSRGDEGPKEDATRGDDVLLMTWLLWSGIGVDGFRIDALVPIWRAAERKENRKNIE